MSHLGKAEVEGDNERSGVPLSHDERCGLGSH